MGKHPRLCQQPLPWAGKLIHGRTQKEERICVRMRRNWSKRLTALMLAILAFAALGTVALADETDPEKDLVIGSEYGGGGSPGEGPEGGGAVIYDDENILANPEVSDEDMAAILSEFEKIYTGNGLPLSGEANGMFFVQHIGNNRYMTDSYESTFAFSNSTNKNVKIKLNLTFVDDHGVVIENPEISDGYVDDIVIESMRVRNFRVYTTKAYSKVLCDVALVDANTNDEYEGISGEFQANKAGSRHSSLEQIYSSEELWALGNNGASAPVDCEGCGVSDGIEENQNPGIKNMGIVWVIIGVCVGICTVFVVLVYRNKKFHGKGYGHEGKCKK